jgi:hypothetical protein
MDTDDNFDFILQTFQELLAVDPVDISLPSLIEVALSVPTIPTAEALALAAYAAAKARPEKADVVLDKVFWTLRDDEVEALKLVDEDGLSNSFKQVFDRQFNEITTDNIYLSEESSNDELRNVSGDSPVLRAVFIQSIAARTELVDSKHHIQVARLGLGLDECSSDGKAVMQKAVPLVFLTVGGCTAVEEIVRVGNTRDEVFNSVNRLKDSDASSLAMNVSQFLWSSQSAAW